MGRIKISMVASAPVEELYKLGMNAVEFPELFPNLDRLHVIERSGDGGYLKAEWNCKY